MKLLILLFILLNIIYSTYTALVDPSVKSYENYKLIEMKGDINVIKSLIGEIKKNDGQIICCDGLNKRKLSLNDLLRLRCDLDRNLNSLVFSKGMNNTMLIMVAPELYQKFKEIASKGELSTRTIYEDYSEIIRMEKKQNLRGGGFSWTAYYDVDDIYDYLRNVSKTYPYSTQVIVGGESYEGRKILGLKIDTPEEKKENGKPVIFIESGIHAREWITPAAITYFINQLLTSEDERIIDIRNRFDWRIFPTVNPDGYHYSYTKDRMWRKTRSQSSNGCFGADPNRNWAYNWLQHGASDDPCDYQTFGGDHPFSEKETRTLAAYIAGTDNLLAYIAFHSDAQILLLPYSDSSEHNDNYDDLVTIGKTSLEYGYEVNKERYGGPATAAEILYKASGGSMDWVRSVLGTPLVYTYELRGYYFHWPPHLIYQQGDEVTQMILGLLTEAENLGYY